MRTRYIRYPEGGAHTTATVPPQGLAALSGLQNDSFLPNLCSDRLRYAFRIEDVARVLEDCIAEPEAIAVGFHPLRVEVVDFNST